MCTYLCVCVHVDLLCVWSADFHDLPSSNQLILPGVLQVKVSRVWTVKAILDCRGRIDPVPGPLEPLWRGPGGAQRLFTVIEIRLHGWNEGVGSMFHHARR